MTLRWIVGLVAALALGWSGWWFVGAGLKRAGLEAWLADRRAEGWQAETRGIEVAGFPNRFDTRVSGLALADPAQGWAWEAPFLDILMLSYAPNAAILAFPPEQVVAAPGARATLATEGLRASIRFVPGPSLELARLSVETRAVALAGEGWSVAAGAAQAHVQAADPATTPGYGYDLFLSAAEVSPPENLAAAGLPDDPIEAVTLDARAALDAPLDRFAVEDRAPGIAALSIKALEARWGALALTASGTLRADARGYAEGRLDVEARNWRRMLRAAVETGALDRDLGRAIEAGLGLLAALSGDGERLRAPLDFEGGKARLGPVTLGPAPRLRRAG